MNRIAHMLIFISLVVVACSPASAAGSKAPKSKMSSSKTSGKHAGQKMMQMKMKHHVKLPQGHHTGHGKPKHPGKKTGKGRLCGRIFFINGQIFILDRNGARIYVLEIGKGIVEVIELPSEGASLVAVNLVRGILYIANIDDQRLDAYDAATHYLLFTLALDVAPAQIAADSTTGNLLVIGEDGSIRVLDGLSAETVYQSTTDEMPDLVIPTDSGLFCWKKNGNEFHGCGWHGFSPKRSYKLKKKIRNIHGSAKNKRIYVAA